MANTKTISLDFDGVIHKYSRKWHDGTIYDSPMDGAIDSLIELQEAGFTLVISSVRKDLEAIKRWLSNNGLPKENLDKIKITNEKPIAMAYVDDRAIRFINWQDIKNYFI